MGVGRFRQLSSLSPRVRSSRRLRVGWIKGRINRRAHDGQTAIGPGTDANAIGWLAGFGVWRLAFGVLQNAFFADPSLDERAQVSFPFSLLR